MKPTIYISGPMTGLPGYNFATFNRHARRFHKLGHKVLNPAETDNGDTSNTWAYYIRKDVRMVTQADMVVVLPGWQKSRGAQLEVNLARAMEMPICDTELKPLPVETICQEADRLVSDDRQESYGHPALDFSRTAKMWGAILGIEITPDRVGLCMIALKLSRLCNAYKRDSVVDIAGYAKTVQMVHEHQKASA